MYCRIRLKDTNYQEYHNYRILGSSALSSVSRFTKTIFNIKNLRIQFRFLRKSLSYLILILLVTMMEMI